MGVLGSVGAAGPLPFRPPKNTLPPSRSGQLLGEFISFPTCASLPRDLLLQLRVRSGSGGGGGGGSVVGGGCGAGHIPGRGGGTGGGAAFVIPTRAGGGGITTERGSIGVATLTPFSAEALRPAVTVSRRPAVAADLLTGGARPSAGGGVMGGTEVPGAGLSFLPRTVAPCDTLLRRSCRRRCRLALLDLALDSRSSLRPRSCTSCRLSCSRSTCGERPVTGQVGTREKLPTPGVVIPAVGELVTTPVTHVRKEHHAQKDGATEASILRRHPNDELCGSRQRPS